jgi:hypothetical protein
MVMVRLDSDDAGEEERGARADIEVPHAGNRRERR